MLRKALEAQVVGRVTLQVLQHCQRHPLRGHGPFAALCTAHEARTALKRPCSFFHSPFLFEAVAQEVLP